MSGKKPTMMQVKNVIDNMLRHLSTMSTRLDQLDGLVDMYITFNKDRDKFKEYVTKSINKKVEEQKNADKEKSGELQESSGADNDAGKGKSRTKKGKKGSIDTHRDTTKRSKIKDTGESGNIGV